MTGYEVKQSYEKGPANFMPISFGQIYPVLAGLEREKLVRRAKEQGARGSIRYFITREGEKALREWLFSAGDPADDNELLLRLFFASPSQLPQLRPQIQAFRRGQQALLDHYATTRKWLNETHGSNPRLPVWKLVLEYGVGQSQARVRWAGRALSTMTNSNSRKHHD